MKNRQSGFSIAEVALSYGIIGILAVVTGTFIFIISRTNEFNTNQINSIWQVENAGAQISRDALMAESVETESLEYPDFLVLSWTERDYDGGNSIYHKATYYFTDVSNNIGKLKRIRWSSGGLDDETLVASNIYCNAADPDNTSKVTYASSVLTVKINTIRGNSTEIKEYIIKHRTTF